MTKSSSGSRVVLCGRPDGQTDRFDEDNRTWKLLCDRGRLFM